MVFSGRQREEAGSQYKLEGFMFFFFIYLTHLVIFIYSGADRGHSGGSGGVVWCGGVRECKVVVVVVVVKLVVIVKMVMMVRLYCIVVMVVL